MSWVLSFCGTICLIITIMTANVKSGRLAIYAPYMPPYMLYVPPYIPYVPPYVPYAPISLFVLPAYGYGKILPQMGFQEVTSENYTPQRGDISVLPQNSSHVFGHIAVYNGKQWVSDFKQNNMLCSKAYRASGQYRIFRIGDGWHWKHVWTSPVDWYGWIQAGIKGWRKIRL